MPKLEFFTSIRDSETIACPRCDARQYQRNGSCIRCNAPLNLEYLTLPIESLLNSDSDALKEHFARVTGSTLRRLRKRRGISQSQLAIRAKGQITRTSLSKAECGRMLLPLYKLLPLARALGLKAVILRFDGTASRVADHSTNHDERSSI